MKLRDVLFTGMDITIEAHKIFDQHMDTSRMTEDEEKAFRFGAAEAFRAVRNILEWDDHIVFHIEGHPYMEEFDIDDLIEIVEEKEGY